MDNTHRPHDVKASEGIKRTAAELAAWRPQVVAEYLALQTSESSSIKHLILYRAVVSSFVSDAMFRQLFVELGFTRNETCGGSEACNDRIAALLGEDPRTVKRLHAQMEKIGLAEKPQRRKNRSSVRGFSPLSLAMILKPVLGQEVTDLSLLISERTDLSLLTPRKDISVPCEPLASDISAPLTLLEEDEEEDRGGACASEPDLEIFESFKSSEPHAIAAEHHFVRWHDIGNRWGQTLGVVALNHPVSRAKADQALTAMLDAFADEPADALRPAFLATMAELEGRILGPQKTVGFSAMASYARNTLKTEIAKAKRCVAELEAAKRQADAAAEIAIAKERTIADQGVAAHAAAVEAGAKIREARAAKPKDEDWRDRKAKSKTATRKILDEFMAEGEQPAPERFDDALPKVVEVHEVWISGRDANRIVDAVEGCTKRLVEDALFQVSGIDREELGAPTRWDANSGKHVSTGKPPIAKVIERATERARKLTAFAKFGKPQTLCGGPVAFAHKIPGQSGTRDVLFESEYACLSENFLARMKGKYPNAWIEHLQFRDNGQYWSSANAGIKDIYSEFRKIVKSVDVAAYGTTMQSYVENKTEEAIVALHARMTRALEAQERTKKSELAAG